MPSWTSPEHHAILALVIILVVLALRTHGKIKEVHLHISLNGKAHKQENNDGKRISDKSVGS